jgi:hypothetical protein
MRRTDCEGGSPRVRYTTARFRHPAWRRRGSRVAARRTPAAGAVPVIGFLHSASDTLPDPLRGFRQGLKDTGYVEGENVAIVLHWALQLGQWAAKKTAECWS